MYDFVLALLLSLVPFVYLISVNRGVADILVVSLALRISLCALGAYAATLPDSNLDALSFAMYARSLASSNFLLLLSEVPPYGNGWLYGWVMGLYSRIVSADFFALAVTSSFGGLLCIINVYRLSFELFDLRTARCSAWIASFSPTTLLYSVLTLREVWISLCLLLLALNLVRWYKNGRSIAMWNAIIAAIVAGSLHGGLLLLLPFLLLTFLFKSILSFQSERKIFTVYNFNLTIFLFFSILCLFFIINGNIPYLNDLTYTALTEYLYSARIDNTRGNFSLVYLSAPQGFFGYISYSIKAMLSFSLNITENLTVGKNQLIIIFESIYFNLLFLISLVICLQRRSEKRTYILLLLAVYFIFFHSQVVGNAGTAIRHKSKIIYLLMPFSGLLLSSYLRRFPLTLQFGSSNVYDNNSEN